MSSDQLEARLACLNFHVDRARGRWVTTRCRQIAARANVRHGFARTRA